MRANVAACACQSDPGYTDDSLPQLLEQQQQQQAAGVQVAPSPGTPASPAGNPQQQQVLEVRLPSGHTFRPGVPITPTGPTLRGGAAAVRGRGVGGRGGGRGRGGAFGRGSGTGRGSMASLSSLSGVPGTQQHAGGQQPLSGSKLMGAAAVGGATHRHAHPHYLAGHGHHLGGYTHRQQQQQQQQQSTPHPRHEQQQRPYSQQQHALQVERLLQQLLLPEAELEALQRDLRVALAQRVRLGLRVVRDGPVQLRLQCSAEGAGGSSVAVHLHVAWRVAMALEVDADAAPQLPFDTHDMRQASFWQHLASMLHKHTLRLQRQQQQQQQQAPSGPAMQPVMHRLVSLLPAGVQAALHGLARLQGSPTTPAPASPPMPHAQAGEASAAAALSPQQQPLHARGAPKLKAGDKRPLPHADMDTGMGGGGKRARKALVRSQHGPPQQQQQQQQLDAPAGGVGGERDGRGLLELRKRRKKPEATGALRACMRW